MAMEMGEPIESNQQKDVKKVGNDSGEVEMKKYREMMKKQKEQKEKKTVNK